MALLLLLPAEDDRVRSRGDAKDGTLRRVRQLHVSRVPEAEAEDDLMEATKKRVLAALKKRDRESLWALYKRYGQGMSRNDAAELCGSRASGYTTAAQGFGSCACNLAVAADCAERGDEHGRQVYEHCAEVCLNGAGFDFLCAFERALAEGRA